MARNEEKQLARLNRLYLQQQKEEELKKRPPRPRLATLTTVEEIKKWLPTVVRDIDFYVTQMEVTCYPKSQIEEFEHRIDQLRGEYKAFIRKMRQLEPDLKTTPWGDRPYTVKRSKMDPYMSSDRKEDAVGEDSGNKEDTKQNDSSNLKTFVPLCTPVLKNSSSCHNWYGFEKPKVPNVDISEIQMQNEPLQFDFGQKLPENTTLETAIEVVNCLEKHMGFTEKHTSFSVHKCNTQVIGTVESCESSVHSQEDSNQEADVSGDGTEANVASRLSHHSTSCTNRMEKCSLNTTQLHILNDNERITTGCSGKYACHHNSLVEKAKIQDSCVSSMNENSGVSLLGSLNIPYTDSSSSDAET